MRALKASASLALLLGLGAITVAAPASAQYYGDVAISVGFAPPPLPYYDQPPIPGYGYIWTPGYWAWDDGYGDYYWVPGTWVLPPRIGFLWTPGWWGWRGGRYFFNSGYWGPHVGFYGGVNYGFGYNGFGYGGGEWRGRDFYYNRSVNNVRNGRIPNVYDRDVDNRFDRDRVSYAGGRGGVQARPTPEQMEAMRERHLSFTPQQEEHIRAARVEPELRAGVNHGAPGIAATARPGAFGGRDAVPARRLGEEGYRPPIGYAPSTRPDRPYGGDGGNLGERPSDMRPQYGRPAPNPRPDIQNGPGQGARPDSQKRSGQGPRPDYQNARPYGAGDARFEPSRPGRGPAADMESRPQPQFVRPQPRFEGPAPQAQPRPVPQVERPQGPRPERAPEDRRDHPQP